MVSHARARAELKERAPRIPPVGNMTAAGTGGAAPVLAAAAVVGGEGVAEANEARCREERRVVKERGRRTGCSAGGAKSSARRDSLNM